MHQISILTHDMFCSLLIFYHTIYTNYQLKIVFIIHNHLYTFFYYRSLGFLQRYCTFHRNEPCSLPILVELLAGMIGKKPDEVALATSFNALKLFGMS